MEYHEIHREIVESCKQGNAQSQYELYRLYSKAMYNICLRMVKNEMDAEDLLQNSFVDVFTKLDSFRFQSSVGAWIKRIVINNCINFLKKKRLYFEEVTEQLGQIEEEEITNDSVLNVETIKEAIIQLPDGYRVVFSLYLLEGYDHQEIAEILKVSVATSKSQYSRAKSKLRSILLNRQARGV
ncbi:MAG: sigma-70 family RNA polymerase sigma factor [Flavobacteriaceae bacterium]|nr:sigma-70 family RNA polymerase sigma factor [Flavobacteriaceae bacterium]